VFFYKKEEFMQRIEKERPLSKTTGYLYSLYLSFQQLAQELNEICARMERTEPWYDKPSPQVL
jgi:hypothetical protein